VTGEFDIKKNLTRKDFLKAGGGTLAGLYALGTVGYSARGSGGVSQDEALEAALAVLVLVLMLAVGTKPAEAAFPGTNGKIAFSSNRDGNPEIFAMNPDGTGLEQLTDNSKTDWYPAWSADGSWMAYTSYPEFEAEIYMRSCGGGGGGFVQTLRLTKNTASDTEPTFNPDRTKIAFVSNRDGGGNYEIYVMDTADTDGNENGDNQTNLTNNPAIDSQPAWSPDGTKIAFQSDRDGNNRQVYVMDADGTDPVNLTNNAAAYDGYPNWFPDGTKIAFARSIDNNADIYVMNADGSEQKRLTKEAAQDYNPAWSPDGKKIAFGTNRRGGDDEIYVMKAKRESKRNRPKNLTKNDVVIDSMPDWRPIP
jgi:Tol biopolymer transport system component